MMFVRLLISALLCMSPVCWAHLPQTDTHQYRNFCVDASKKETVFKCFRNHPIMQATLERYDKNQGQEFETYILNHYSVFTSLWDLFRENDRFGQPVTQDFQAAGTCSPATLRYIKIAGDLQAFFMPLENLRIIEIGGGYGGLCRILTQVFHVKSYTIVDWPEPLMLAKKYLNAFHITSVKFLTPDQLGAGLEADLVISNDAFTLFPQDLQEQYLKQIIKQAPRGYMLCSYPESMDFPSLKPKELSSRLRKFHLGVHTLSESPKTCECCWLHVWNDP